MTSGLDRAGQAAREAVTIGARDRTADGQGNLGLSLIRGKSGRT